MTAASHAHALSARLSEIRLRRRVAVAAGDEQSALAHAALKSGLVACAVIYSDTDGGVVVERHTQDALLARLIDAAVATAAIDVGTFALELGVRGAA